MVRNTPDQNAVHCPENWMPYGCQIWSESQQEHSVLLRSTVTRGSPGVNQRSICLEMPYGYQIWSEEVLTRESCIVVVKGNAGVSQGQPEVKLLWNVLQWLNLVRTPDQSTVHCWGQRSLRNQPESTRNFLLTNAITTGSCKRLKNKKLKTLKKVELWFSEFPLLRMWIWV